MHGDEDVVAQEAALHQPLLRCDIDRIGVLDEQCRHGAAMAKRFGISGQNAADLRLVEHAHIRIVKGAADEFALVQPENVVVRMEGAAALMFPGAEHRGNGGCGMIATEPLRWRVKP